MDPGDDKLARVIDLIRRLPHKDLEGTVDKLKSYVEDEDELLNNVDLPLKTQMDPKTGNYYVLSDYNLDLGAYRSPWSNQYYPAAAEDAVFPPESLRRLEKDLNAAFKVYADMYYEGAVSSVYLWKQGDEDEIDDNASFSCAILFSKTYRDSKWDSIHTVQIGKTESQGTSSSQRFKYTLTSTILMSLASKQTGVEFSLDLSGNVTRTAETEASVASGAGESVSHVMNLGSMIEEIENKLRNEISEIYFSKTKDILNNCRSYNSLGVAASQKNVHNAFLNALSKRIQHSKS